MKKYLVTALFFLLSIGIFSFHRSEAYFQDEVNGHFNYTPSPAAATYVDGNNSYTTTLFPGAMGGFPEAYFASTSQAALQPDSYIRSVILYVFNNSSSTDSTTMSASCTDGSGTHSGTSDATTTLISGFYYRLVYNFSTPVLCDSSSLVNLILVNDLAAGNPTRYSLAATDRASQTGLGIGIRDTSSHTHYDYTTRYTMSVNEDFGLVDTGNLTSEGISAVVCGPTTFSVAGADFGQGLCNVVKSLFLPSSSAIEDFSQVITNLQQRIPFSYFYDITTSVTSQSTTGSSSPITSLDFVSSSTALHITYSTFSSTTASQYMGSTLYNLFLYALMGDKCPS